MNRPYSEWTQEEKDKWVDSFSDTMVEAIEYLVENDIPIPKLETGGLDNGKVL